MRYVGIRFMKYMPYYEVVLINLRSMLSVLLTGFVKKIYKIRTIENIYIYIFTFCSM